MIDSPAKWFRLLMISLACTIGLLGGIAIAYVVALERL